MKSFNSNERNKFRIMKQSHEISKYYSEIWKIKHQRYKFNLSPNYQGNNSSSIYDEFQVFLNSTGI